MAKLSIRDLELNNKYLFVRVDFNVPLSDSGLQILDDTRIKETLPTLEYALRHHAKVIVASHLGRPKGKPNAEMSLKPVAQRLEEMRCVKSDLNVRKIVDILWFYFGYSSYFTLHDDTGKAVSLAGVLVYTRR